MSNVYSFDFTGVESFFHNLNKAFVSATDPSTTEFPTRSYWCQDGNLHIDMENIHRLNVVLKYKFNKHTNKELFIDDIQDSVVIFKATDGSRFNDLAEVVEPGSLTESILKWIKVYEDDDDMVIKPPLKESTVHFYIRKSSTTVHMKSNERYILKAPHSRSANNNFFQIFPLQNYDSTKPVIENFNLFKVGSDVFDAAYTLVYYEQRRGNSKEFKVSITDRSFWIIGSRHAVGFGVCKTALRSDAPYIYHPIDRSLDQEYFSLLDDRFLVEFDGRMIEGQSLRYNGYRDMSYAINTIVGLREDQRIVLSNNNNTRTFYFPIAELDTKTVVGTRNGSYGDLTIIDNQKHLFIRNSSNFDYNICVRI